MNIIGFAGTNRIPKGSCALFLQDWRGYSVLTPDDTAAPEGKVSQDWFYQLLIGYMKHERLVVADVRTNQEADAIRKLDGLIVHLSAQHNIEFGSRDVDLPASADVRQMHAILQIITLNYEVALAEATRHALAG